MVPEGKVKVKVLSPFQRAAKKRDRTLLGARAVRHPSGVPHRARGKAAELLRPAVVCLFLQPPDCASVHRRARGLLDPLRLHKAPPHASGHQPSPWPSSCTGQGEDQASRWRLAAAGGRSLLRRLRLTGLPPTLRGRPGRGLVGAPKGPSPGLEPCGTPGCPPSKHVPTDGPHTQPGPGLPSGAPWVLLRTSLAKIRSPSPSLVSWGGKAF